MPIVAPIHLRVRGLVLGSSDRNVQIDPAVLGYPN